MAIVRQDLECSSGSRMFAQFPIVRPELYSGRRVLRARSGSRSATPRERERNSARTGKKLRENGSYCPPSSPLFARSCTPGAALQGEQAVASRTAKNNGVRHARGRHPETHMPGPTAGPGIWMMALFANSGDPATLPRGIMTRVYQFTTKFRRSSVNDEPSLPWNRIGPFTSVYDSPTCGLKLPSDVVRR